MGSLQTARDSDLFFEKYMVPIPRGLFLKAEQPLHFLREDFTVTHNLHFPGAKQQQRKRHQESQLICTFKKLYFRKGLESLNTASENTGFP